MLTQQRPQELTLTLPQALQRALSFHQDGRFGECEYLYSQILKSESDHFDANHLLGVLRCQQGRHEEALELIGKALKIMPDSAEACSNHGVVLQQLGRYLEALDSFEKALTIKPDYAEALNNRGNALLELKQYRDALASYDQALKINPDYPEARSGRAIALKRIGDNGDTPQELGLDLENRLPNTAETGKTEDGNPAVTAESAAAEHGDRLEESRLPSVHLLECDLPHRDTPPSAMIPHLGDAAEPDQQLSDNLREGKPSGANGLVAGGGRGDGIDASADRRLPPAAHLRLPPDLPLGETVPFEPYADIASFLRGFPEQSELGTAGQSRNVGGTPDGNLSGEVPRPKEPSLAKEGHSDGDTHAEQPGEHVEELTEPLENPNVVVGELIKARRRFLQMRLFRRLALGSAAVLALAVFWHFGSHPVQVAKSRFAGGSEPAVHRAATEQPMHREEQTRIPASTPSIEGLVPNTKKPAPDARLVESGTSATAELPAAAMQSVEPVDANSVGVAAAAAKPVISARHGAEATATETSIDANVHDQVRADQVTAPRSATQTAPPQTQSANSAENERQPAGATASAMAPAGAASPTFGGEASAVSGIDIMPPERSSAEINPTGMQSQEAIKGKAALSDKVAVTDKMSETDKAAGPKRGAAAAREPTPAQTRSYAIRALDADEVAMLVMRGEEFIGIGDIPAARLLLQRAAEAGDPRAALVLGGTYDPLILKKLKVPGLAPDISMARTWYERAIESGSAEAARRLEVLGSQGN